VIFVGYHARSGSENAVLAHTWSSKRVANVWLNDTLVGEIGLNSAVCGYFGSPVLMITGDQTACAEGEELLGSLETVAVKRSTGFSSAECLHPEVAQARIQETAKKAVSTLKEGKTTKPFVVSEPVKVTLEFRLSAMADYASRMPGAKRINATCIEMTAPDMPLAYQAFRMAVRAA
jgi:D-amino peptidase